MKDDICFVVLHYNVMKETEKCVEYIKKNVDTDNYHIIIVDNASPDGSGSELRRSYKNDAKTIVLLAKENVGFARGNNIGIRYCRRKYNPKYIVAMNNDVYLLEKQLYEKLDNEYSKSGFSVLGPKVITPKGNTNTNPVSDIPMDAREVRSRLCECSLKLWLWKLGLQDMIKVTFFKRFYPVRKRLDSKKYHYNVKLHGCFLVFSEKYFERFQGFEPRTFMFLEEEILYQNMLRTKLISVYTPEIEVFHKEDVSTDATYKSDKKKAIFGLRNHIQSYKVLLTTWKENSYEK